MTDFRPPSDKSLNMLLLNWMSMSSRDCDSSSDSFRFNSYRGTKDEIKIRFSMAILELRVGHLLSQDAMEVQFPSCDRQLFDELR